MIREVRLDDIDRVDELYRILFEDMQTLEPDYMTISDQDPLFLQSVISQENDFIGFVYQEDEQVEGLIVAQLQTTPPYKCFVPQRCVYLMDIIVAPEQRGRGIGKQLIDEVKQWASGHGVDYLELNVLSSNEPALSLYRREGFKPFSQSMRMRLK
ncbi:MAG: GNAT family N-acetyltransferase [Sphingobacteriaceae bacterium]